MRQRGSHDSVCWIECGLGGTAFHNGKPSSPRSMPATLMRCTATSWTDGGTMNVMCGGSQHRIRVRSVDPAERGQAGYAEPREELRRRTQGCPLVIIPHHRSYDRLFADVICRGAGARRAILPHKLNLEDRVMSGTTNRSQQVGALGIA